jgi:hypothetical protein
VAGGLGVGTYFLVKSLMAMDLNVQVEQPVVVQAPPKAKAAGPQIGQVAPEIVAEDLDGQTFKLSDYRGKVVLLDFWGNW